jgi:hypothetical protein
MSLATLQTALEQIDAQILSLTASVQPDYSLDGQSESMSAHLAMLLDRRAALRQAILDEEGPYETWTRGMT